MQGASLPRPLPTYACPQRGKQIEKEFFQKTLDSASGGIRMVGCRSRESGRARSLDVDLICVWAAEFEGLAQKRESRDGCPVIRDFGREALGLRLLVALTAIEP